MNPRPNGPPSSSKPEPRKQVCYVVEQALAAFITSHSHLLAGTEFGAKHAEAIFLGGQSPEKVRSSVDSLRSTARSNYNRDPTHIKMIAGMTVIIDETDEKAYAKRDELLTYGDREGALALFGGWTGIDLSTYGEDEDFRFVKLPAVQSMVQRWSETVPGTEGLKWTKGRIAEFILLGGELSHRAMRWLRAGTYWDVVLEI